MHLSGVRNAADRLIRLQVQAVPHSIIVSLPLVCSVQPNITRHA